MNFFYTRLFVLSAMLLPFLAGCESYVQPLGGTNPTIPDKKQGQDCRVHVFGIGGVPDVTGTQAMHSVGGLSILRAKRIGRIERGSGKTRLLHLSSRA
jgi:hypothetical protein